MDNNISYEEALKRIDEIVDCLERGEVPLDEALKLFEEGTALTGLCYERLENAKQKITEIKVDEKIEQ
ncbi:MULTISPECIES: exodeoxyribonuclease VII small subunit [unclassified Ruminococcus]|uniref:exodeoxyribonuclease VII small subunit n=1 Tax=unclassified Ruminococcus TaxID=2608920 RepID=UPI00210D03C8|nr:MULTISPECIES: exodeoxyribonuclease VII small subunit [unclassified Ruminococcus]MCQ4022256.1 exodeoxyribonuclease VII small subunit [Ruminococcus sp. zg-924]MCQ4114584.1 exodeoxyribonuclease VII small subunit [Ruminococcus sp. zg-921]